MPAQTTLRSKMKVADGTKLQIKLPSDSVYTDLGVVSGDTNITLEWDDFQEESANAGVSDKYIKNPKANGSFTLQQLDYDNISKLSSGLMEKVTTAASANTSIPDQDIDEGWEDNVRYELIMYTSSTDDTKLKMATQPVLTSVTLNHETPEVLAEDTDYVVCQDPDSFSGWSIQFISGNMGTESPTSYSITIDYGSNTPVARSTYHIGTSTQLLTSFDIKLEHTDANSLVYGVEIYECYSNSGSLVFMFKSAAESGFNEMPFSFTGVVDISRDSGRQLMAVYEDTGAI